MMVHNFLLF